MNELTHWLCLCTISAGEGFDIDASLVFSLLYLIAQGPSESINEWKCHVFV